MEGYRHRGKFGRENYRKQTRRLSMKWAWFHSNNILVLHQEKGYCHILFLMFICSYVYWAPATQTLSKHQNLDLNHIMSVKSSLSFLMTCYWLIPVESIYREVSLPFRNDNGGWLVTLRDNPFNLSIYQFCPQLEYSGIVLCILPVLPLQVCYIL